MGISEKNWPRREFTLSQVDFLNRSPFYKEWRESVAHIFSRIDPLLDEEMALQGQPRLVVVIAPAELPVGAERMWERLKGRGRMLSLRSSPREVKDYLPLLLTGATAGRGQPTIAQRYAAGPDRSRYDTWVIEADQEIAGLQQDSAGLVGLSYEALAKYRNDLLARVQKILQTEKIFSPRQMGQKLSELKAALSHEDEDPDPLVADFVRSVLLTGNGTLLINNTFVQWSAIQAIRRARPTVAVIGFGIRNKIKPFSSLLIYADQEKSTPIPTQMDTLGTYVDLEVLSHYVWLECEKYVEYRRNTVYLFVAEGMDELLALAPPDFFMTRAGDPKTLEEVFAWAGNWIGLS